MTASTRSPLIVATALAAIVGTVTLPIGSGHAHDGGPAPDMISRSIDVPTGIQICTRPLRAGQLHIGMSKGEVERAMSHPTHLERIPGTGVEVGTFWADAEEPLSSRVTFRDGALIAVALDVADVNRPNLPAFMKTVIPGFARTGVVHALGSPQEDYEETIDGMVVEHMIFESRTRPTASVFLSSGRVVSIGAGRDAPARLSKVTLPTAPAVPTGGQPIERIRLGMTPNEVIELRGGATWTVHSSFKGLLVLSLNYATPEGSVVAQFKFIGGALTEMSSDSEVPPV